MGEICNSLAISAEINDLCTPLSNRILARVFISPATMGVIAVSSRIVGFWGASEHDAGVINSSVVGVLPQAHFFSEKLLLGTLFSSDVVVLGYCMYNCRGWCDLHFLQHNLDVHCDG